MTTQKADTTTTTKTARVAELLLVSSFFIACGDKPLNVPNGSDAGSVTSDGSGASSGSGTGFGTSDGEAEADKTGDGDSDAAGDSGEPAPVSAQCVGKSCGNQCDNGEFPAFCDRHGACVVLLPGSSCTDS